MYIRDLEVFPTTTPDGELYIPKGGNFVLPFNTLARFLFKQSCINLSSLNKFMWHEELGRVSSTTTWLDPYFTCGIFCYISQPRYGQLHIFINTALGYCKWRIIIRRNEAWNNFMWVLRTKMLSSTPICNADKSPG